MSSKLLIEHGVFLVNKLKGKISEILRAITSKKNKCSKKKLPVEHLCRKYIVSTYVLNDNLQVVSPFNLRQVSEQFTLRKPLNENVSWSHIIKMIH